MTDKTEDRRPNDADVAASFRAEVKPLLDRVAAIMNATRDEHGLNTNFSIGMDQWGRRVVGPIDVSRPL